MIADTLPSRLVQHASREAHFSINIIGKEKEKKVRFEDNEMTSSSPAKVSEKPGVPIEGVIIKDRKTGELLPFGEHQVQQKVEEITPVVQESEEVRLKGKLRWLFEQDRMFWESNDTKVTSESSKGLGGGQGLKPCSDQQQQPPPKGNEVSSRSSKGRNGNKHHACATRTEALRCSSLKMPAGGLHEDGKGQKERGNSRIEKDRQSKQNHKPENRSHCHVPGMKASDTLAFKRDTGSSSPIKSGEFRDAKGSFDEVPGAGRLGDVLSSGIKPAKALPSKETSKVDKLRKSASFNLPWGFSSSKNKMATEDAPRSETAQKCASSWKARLSPDRNTGPKQEDTTQKLEPQKLFQRPEVRASPPPLVEAEVSELDLGGGDAYFTDYEDAAANSPQSSSDEDEDETDEMTKVGAAGYVEDMKDKTTLLKAKCDLLAKEKDIAVRKWKRSCVEIEQAAQMAQALRSAIETLLEVSIGSVSTAEFKSKRSSLEEHSRTLKARMEKLRRRSAEIHPHPEPEDLLNVSLVGRIETLKKTPEVRGLASPEVPRDTENKVEDLKARLEKLMLATNSRVTDEREPVISRSREKKKKPPKDTLHPEKAELKMRGWYNSLSAELSTELTANLIDHVQPNGSIDKCDMSSENGHTIEPSCSVTPATSKQVSPLHHLHQVEDTASTHSSEETKMRVIHKIAEEVRAESEQWYQVQELLQRVGEDMKRLQEACSTWERRALLAEAQVETLLHEDQERRERSQTGDQKMAELQTEMARLRDTVDEVRKQLGSVDPSRWFEAAEKFGYAFVPVMRPTLSGNYSFRHQSPADDDAREPREDRAEMRQKSAAVECDVSSDHWRPSCSGTGSQEKTRTVPQRRHHKLPSLQWANEIAKAEEEEILQSKTLSRSVTAHSRHSSRPEFVDSSIVKDDISLPERHHHQDASSLQEKAPKPLKLDTKSDYFDRDESKEVIPLSPVPKESTTDDLLRNANLSSSCLTRSPLKVVLGNVAPSKENKKPL